MKLSFCTTCMNRLPQLAQTLPPNLELARKYNAEITLVNYNSADGLDEWIRANAMGAIKEGHLRYIHEKSVKHFHASKAKNLAHRLATGNVLFNLDADNFIDDNVRYVVNAFTVESDIVIHNWSGILLDGTFGRICMTRGWFERLGGYDESFHPVGCQDTDLLNRAVKSGLKYGELQGSKAIKNTKEDTVRYAGGDLSYDAMNLDNIRRSTENLDAGKLKANLSGFAKARVSINFGPDQDFI